MKKIRNIDISVCVGEQVIAYKFACWLYDVKMTTEKATRIVEQSLQKKEFNEFDKDLIIKVFKDNFEKYRNEKYHILGSYQEVGNIFTINTENC